VTEASGMIEESKRERKKNKNKNKPTEKGRRCY
jgi:hypothetical protein